jgi:hypothetical protein
MGRQELARVHDPVGIEAPPEPEHEVEIGVAILLRHALGLVQADAVLTRHAAAEAQARRHQLLVDLHGALVSPGTRSSEIWQVAVARRHDLSRRADGLHRA